MQNKITENQSENAPLLLQLRWKSCRISGEYQRHTLFCLYSDDYAVSRGRLSCVQRTFLKLLTVFTKFIEDFVVAHKPTNQTAERLSEI